MENEKRAKLSFLDRFLTRGSLSHGGRRYRRIFLSDMQNLLELSAQEPFHGQLQ
jgi:hypothetical protein